MPYHLSSLASLRSQPVLLKKCNSLVVHFPGKRKFLLFILAVSKLLNSISSLSLFHRRSQFRVHHLQSNHPSSVTCHCCLAQALRSPHVRLLPSKLPHAASPAVTVCSYSQENTKELSIDNKIHTSN